MNGTFKCAYLVYFDSYRICALVSDGIPELKVSPSNNYNNYYNYYRVVILYGQLYSVHACCT